MSDMPLLGKNILVTGAARRIGRSLARACAQAGANIVVHFHDSEKDAAEVRAEIAEMGRRAMLVKADLENSTEVEGIVKQGSELGPLHGLVNNAAIFQSLTPKETTLEAWERHLAINLTAPFLLSKAFAEQVPKDGSGRIVNIVDWRALRPGPDHFPYTITKAALASMTHSLAAALAPQISVNALALGAILPPSDNGVKPEILKTVPAGRWGELLEVEETLIFLLSGPAYITGEIIHVDGGRHLI
ncbi:MAG TPA: SDR family oxidoreductase [Anaerolineales bacterium]|nr:SDR family oxidoreductase [Anaerolineales bacterium]